MGDDLIPLKCMIAELGVSRATFWRLSRTPGFPPPLKMLSRLYWREGDLAAMEAALDRFQGRSVFERERRHAKARQAVTKATAASAKKPKRVRTVANTLAQPDLFGGPVAPAPGGAERLK
jgi:predicted DNA-binding transcriptional regulator AlpA